MRTSMDGGKTSKEKWNILFLDFDDVLNSIRGLYKRFADYHGVTWTEEDFDPKYWGLGHPDNINPDLQKRLEKALNEQKSNPDYKAPDLSCDQYPHDEIAIANLNKIVEENNAKVVVCSSWRVGRTKQQLQEILDSWGAKCEVIGVTPSRHRFSISSSRGDEIYQWIIENKKIIKGICVLDDSASFDINHLLKEWCVQDITGYKHGLRDIHIPEAKKCFKTPLKIKTIAERAHY